MLKRLIDLDEQLDGLGKIGYNRVKFLEVIVGALKIAESEANFARVQK
jgi:hypothetical protein